MLQCFVREIPKWWFSKGNPLISGKSRLVKYYNLARLLDFILFFFRSAPSLKLTYPLKMDGWKRRSGFLFGFRPIFRGVCW